MAELSITEFTDPACPFAWSAEPSRRRLQWLFGEQNDGHLRMVGLSSDPEEIHRERLHARAPVGFAAPPRRTPSHANGHLGAPAHERHHSGRRAR
jgi:hypothetical protein